MDNIYYKNLIEKYFAGCISDEEVIDLVKWIKTDPNLQKWLESEYKSTDDNIDVQLRDKLWNNIKRQTVEASDVSDITHKFRKFNFSSIMKWAAVVCLPLCLAVFSYYLISSNATSSASLVVKADKGNRTSVDLPDGSSVILNSDSKLSYDSDFGKKERKVILDGEAYFKIKHDEKKTFIVQTKALDVKVLGTTFNVSAYEDNNNVTIVLMEGKVGLYAFGFSHTMKPGEKVEYDKTKKLYSSSAVMPNDYIEWTKGNFYFEKESLENIMKTFSRVYGVRIRFDSNTLPQDRFTGTIPNGGIQNSLNILMLTTHLHYEVEGSDIVIKGKSYSK